MGRPSTLPTFATMADAVHAVLTDDTVALKARTKSGPEYTDLLRRMHDADARCVACDLPTLFTRWDGPQTATLGHIVPPSIIAAMYLIRQGVPVDEVSNRHPLLPSGDAGRLGYVPGILALFCRACVDASNAYGETNAATYIWSDGPISVDRVWPAWPKGLRKSTRPEMPTGPEFRAIARAAQTHAAASRTARIRKGFPF